MTTARREWIEEFEPKPDEADHALLVEIVIQERGGNYFDIYQTYPLRRLLVRLTLDECLGYAALAIINGRGARWQTIEQERQWKARYGPRETRALEPWEKQLPERAGAR
jgi:hypothetical protein